MPERAVRYPEVDALRAFAAIAVLGTHVAVFAGADYPGSEVGRFAQRLEVGLTIFFVISGFLLYRPFVAGRVAGKPGPGTVAYGWRRVLRIAPAYWVALTVTAVVLSRDEVFASGTAPYYYLLGQTYSGETLSGGLTQAWTLTVEVAFYAFLPLWAWLMQRAGGTSLRAELAGLLVLVVISEAWKGVVLAGTDPQQVVITPMLIALPAYFDQFALGMALAVLTVRLQRGDPPRAVRVVDGVPWLPWLVALVAFWVVSTRIGIGDEFFEPFTPAQYLARHWLYALIGVCVVLPAVVGTPGRGVVRRLLAHPVLAWLGLISYGIYLWHLTMLSLLEKAGIRDVGPAYLTWPLAGLATAVIAGAASWYLVERPALSLKRLVPARKPRTAPLPAPPEPQPSARIADPS